MTNQQQLLEEAIKNEKDRKIKERLKAVRFVLFCGNSIDHATDAYCILFIGKMVEPLSN